MKTPWKTGFALIVSFGTLFAQRDGETLRFGMSTALSGPAAALGLAMRDGVETAFDEVNRQGGIRGRKLELIALDDGYEPSRAAPNVRKLIDDSGVLGIVGNVGTPTAVASIPVAIEKKTPFFGAFTGAGVLRKSPPDRYVINYRASYAEETAAMVDALLDHAGLAPEEVGFFTQRDAYGDAGFSGGLTALKRRGLANERAIAHGRYERNTTSIEAGLADILQNSPLPRAIIMVGAYAPCAAFIREARNAGLDAIFLNVSFVGTAALIKELGDGAGGVIITQVVPPLESELPAVSRFRTALSTFAPKAQPSFGSLEGYLSSQVLLRALASIVGMPTREGIVDALEGLGRFDIGLGEPLELSKDRHQADSRVWPTIVRESTAVGFDWADLKAHAPVSKSR